MGTSLEPLFRPRGVAVVGASRAAGSIGQLVVKNLVDLGYPGRIYPVNPNARAVRGLPCAPDVEAIPDDEVDLAVVCVPARFVPEVIAACGRRGVGAAVIVTAGFRETGADGAALEDALRSAADAAGLRLVGPNCMGVVSTDPDLPLNASFAAAAPLAGNVAFASQSGALGEAILARARDMDLGLSAFVSLGNKTDVSAHDLLAWWGDDPRTHVILLYLEGLGDTRRFADLARRVTRAGKPVLVVKSGRSAAGAEATASHTGSLAGMDEAMSVLLESSGVQRVTRVEGLFNLARAFSHQPVPRGPRVAILTNAGGPGIMAADAATAYGLEMATFSSQTVEALRAVLPSAASLQNPVDAIATATAEQFGACLAAVLVDPGVDAVLPIFVTPAVTDVRAVAREVVASVARAREVGARGKPVLACFMGGRGAEARGILQAASVPTYEFPEDAAQALGAMARFRTWLDRAPGERVAVPLDAERLTALVAGRPAGWLPAAAALDLLAAAGLPVAAAASAAAPAEAAAAAAALGAPRVVLKADHPDLLHKTEAGGVRLGLEGPEAVEAAAEAMLDGLSARGVDGAGLLVQAQAAPGRELIVGARVDPAVGPVLVFGLGGVETEVLQDVVLRVLPITDRDADDMLDGIRGAPLLRGFRGAAAVDRAAVRDVLLRVGALLEAAPRVAEVEVNPLVAGPEGAVAVDARIRLAEPDL